MFKLSTKTNNDNIIEYEVNSNNENEFHNNLIVENENLLNKYINGIENENKRRREYEED